MAVRVGINGMGRIGRTFWRVCRARSDLDIVAVNDLCEPATLAHLLRFDSIRGRFTGTVHACDASIAVDGKSIAVLRRPQPGDVPWGDHGVDVVLEATGRFSAAAAARAHLAGGARRVLVSTATTDPDVTVFAGINDHEFDARRHAVVSAGCCTSGAVAPILTVLRQLFGIEGGMLTTIHAYNAGRSVLHDSPHADPRLGRAAALNLVPARLRPGSLHALGSAFPELVDRLEGMQVRVPASIGCAVEIVLHTDRTTSAAEVNGALAAAAAGSLKGFLGYTRDPLVSTDIRGAAESCIVDSQLTAVIGCMVKVLAWYDNEWGFASRLADVAGLIGDRCVPCP